MTNVNGDLTQFSLAEEFSREFLLHHGVCPESFTQDGSVIVSVASSPRPEAIADIAEVYNRPVATRVISQHELEQLIERLTTRSDRAIELARVESVEDDATADVRGLANQPPVVRYVNLLVRDAYDAGASDIHLESTLSGLRARFRLDGILVTAPEPPAQLHLAVVSRIKLLAELDIAERRRPQDGRIRVRLEQRELDLRVSTVPTLFGESVVLRLLDRGGRPVALEELGMPEGVLQIATELATKPHGMVLVTGPTGSGKTTTLYAALQRRKADTEKIVTVEDPVEYQLGGITQVPVHRQAGVSFGSALRSLLRQDPDVVMIGEMRDSETAEIAIQAAMTGHLVFSTLHTNDAVGAVPRLLDLGVPAFLVAATLEGVLAQRLVRRICQACTEPIPLSHAAAINAGFDVDGDVVVARGRGCSRCRGTGYHGRVGIFELFPIPEEVKDAISRAASRGELRRLALVGGMRTLRDDGLRKVLEGVTTLEEVLRVATS
jgi:type II secretory ATPase GspE/PulE/Tfp pilus assembly ATPase PilB-like protein